VGDKIWLTNGQALPFKKHWPGVPVMELSTSNKGLINDWEPVEKMFRSKELHKTQGRYLIAKNELNKTDIEFIDEYLDKWLGYCEETLFDINLSIIDDKNVMAISQNSLVYDRLESLDIKVHKVPFRHRFFWDGGLHCITNDLVRKS
jgi:arginine deiminase